MDESGGEGADFDASLYYTKVEIDDIISSVRSIDVDHDKELGASTTSGFATNVPIDIPSGAKIAIIKVEWSANPTPTDVRIFVWDSDNAHAVFTPAITNTSGSYMLVVDIKGMSGGLKAWMEFGGGGNVGVPIQIRPMLFLQ